MEITRIFDTAFDQLENPLEVALAAKNNGTWKIYSTQHLVETVNKLSLGLLQQGIKPNDKIGLVSLNRPEWVFADLAILQIGAINVPMYPNSTSDDYKFIIQDAGIKLIFSGDKAITEKLAKSTAQLEEKPTVYSFDTIENIPGWEELLIEGDFKTLTGYREKIKNEDLATIIYTSGTTGKPKGVMLSHKNILSNADAVGKAFPQVNPKSRTLSFLPLCHIFERTALYTYMRLRVSIYYAESMDTIAENLKEVKPHFFATVPRLLEKVYDKIVAKGYEQKGIKKRLFFWALNLGLKYELNQSQGLLYNLQLRLANAIIFSKWREALGNHVEFIVSGAAALQPRLARVFWAARIKILEAYGLTETSPGISFTRGEPENARIGCVGPLLEHVQVKIAEDGEILVKGPNVMMGYYKRPEATAEVIDDEGWLHTGDVGKMVEGRFLKITDRKKEMFKTSGGKYIAPQYLENKFKESLYIDQVMVVGEGHKFAAALIVPAFDALKEWCLLKKIPYSTDQEILANELVKKKFDQELERLNQHFAQYEKIKRYKLLAKPWTIEGGELTPTLKLRRKVIHAKFTDAIENLYA